MSAHVGVDVGGGGIRVRAELGGRPFDRSDRAPVPRRDGRIDGGGLAARIGDLLAPLRDDPVERVAIGLTGMPELLDAEEFALAVRRAFPSGSTIVATDALTTHLGALAGESGTVVSAGTGAVACATDFAGVWRRGDGWGHLVGDEGSGAWIGAAGIRAALRASDGRDAASSALLDAVRLAFGSTDALVADLYSAGSAAHELAAFAPLVAEAARAGDPQAFSIWQQAGALLAETAHAASSGVAARYSWAGRLFDAGDILLGPFRAELLRRDPTATVVPPAGQAADGALRLARTGLGRATGLLDGYALELAD
ncbi:MAG: N-acetylglucosamine kinase [Microbacterium sp.]